MVKHRKMPLFQGVGTALVTPFAENEKIDTAMLKKLLDYQIAGHADAVILSGTTGESATLTDAEKELLFSTAAEQCSGRIPLIAGVGSNDTAHTQRLAALAEKCGMDGLLVVTPYYNKTTQKGAYAHFCAVAEATSLPIILYNIPSRTGMELHRETVCRLAENEQFCGIKEASGSMEKIAGYLRDCPQNFAVWAGNDQETLPVLSLGGAGVISVSSNLVPNVLHYICQLFWAGEHQKAAVLQHALVPLTDYLFQKTNPIPVKSLMPLLNMPCGSCRMPLEQLTPEEQQLACDKGKALLAPLLGHALLQAVEKA